MVELRMAVAAAMLVVTAMCAMALPSPTPMVEPGLKPNQPNQSTSPPRVTMDMLWPKIGLTEPSARYLPRRGPEEEDAGERRPAADRVDDRGAGEVEHAQRTAASRRPRSSGR